MEGPTGPREAIPVATTTAGRPSLRKVLKPSPEFLAHHVDEATRTAARSYLASHSQLPDEIRRGITGSEVWLGMTEEELQLVLGPPSSTEAVAGKAKHRALLYGDEGWVFRVNSRGFLYEYVER